jgi:hypothetical protein
MSYLLNKTNGTVLPTIKDGTIDQKLTDLTLFGKSCSSYGEFLNENFLHLLENFAKSTSPPRPIEGQIWYDSLEKRLKVYDGNGFRLTGGTLVSASLPSSISQGDIWIDTARHLLHFHDGTSVVLAGPQDPATAGFQIVTVNDKTSNPHMIMKIIIDERLFGIFSSETFLPENSVDGFDEIVTGINFSNLSMITNITDPVNDGDAVNYRYAKETVYQQAPYAISLDITSLSGTEDNPADKNPAIITEYLNKVFPVGKFELTIDTTVYPECRAVCTDTSNNTTTISIRQFSLKDGSWQFDYEV